MNELSVTPKDQCRWDLISLGEVLLRFCPGDERIESARDFRVFDGGGEYNVARNLAKTFRHQTAVVTALADNALGRLAENLVRAGEVDVSQILWRDAANARNGVYYIERGYGLRAPASCFDRAGTAVSELKSGDFNWREIFAGQKTRWFHTGGIFAGLSESAPAVASEAMQTARANNSVVSYDLNYRDSLWRVRGGLEAANVVNRQLLGDAHIAFGAFDFDSRLTNFNQTAFQTATAKMFVDFPNLQIVVSTLRAIHSASRHDLSAVAATRQQIFQARQLTDIEVFDRVGSGDAFAAGFIHAFLSGRDVQYAVDCGTAAAALAMTTPGDNLMVTAQEISNLMKSGDAAAKR